MKHLQAGKMEGHSTLDEGGGAEQATHCCLTPHQFTSFSLSDIHVCKSHNMCTMTHKPQEPISAAAPVPVTPLEDDTAGRWSARHAV
eukprot:1159317-Pelagomonas_calceolata.AAC.6